MYIFWLAIWRQINLAFLLLSQETRWQTTSVGLLYHDRPCTNHGEKLMKHGPCKDKQSREAANARLGQRKESSDLGQWSCTGHLWSQWLSWGVVNALTLFIDHTCCKQKMLADLHVHTQNCHCKNSNVVFFSLTLLTFCKKMELHILYYLNTDKLSLT